MNGYQLRHHLARAHALRIMGADWGTLQTLHSIEHRPGVEVDHDHAEGPNPAEWGWDCIGFGCEEHTDAS